MKDKEVDIEKWWLWWGVMAGDVLPVAMFFNCISDGFTLDILLNLNWNFQKISNGIALKFQLGFLWISIDMWIKFQLDFKWVLLACLQYFNWILNVFPLIFHWNVNRYLIEISTGISLKFQLDFQLILIDISLKF